MTIEKILIVEDEENERTGLAELVSAWGYRAETARDGMEGLEKIESLVPASWLPTSRCRAWTAWNCWSSIAEACRRRSR